MPTICYGIVLVIRKSSPVEIFNNIVMGVIVAVKGKHPVGTRPHERLQDEVVDRLGGPAVEVDTTVAA